MTKDIILASSLFSIILILVSPICGSALCESDAEDARSAVESAEEALGSAYLSVLEAERAGGDVSGLVASLNDALEERSRAERAFESGEYDAAVLLAGGVAEGSGAVLDDAVRLRGYAELSGKIALRNQMVISFEIIYFTIIFGFLGWSLFRDRYLRRMMGLRPEVVADEP